MQVQAVPELVVLLFILSIFSAGCRSVPPESSDDRAVIAGEMERALRPQLLEKWYPLAVDTTSGGYLSNFNYRFEPEEQQTKMIVTQARHVWTAAKAAEWFPEDSRYLETSRHGYPFLRDVMWDDEYGGFYNLVTRDGEVIPENDGRIIKQAYGNAFAIYGLAALYRASGDTSALQLARDAFLWLENHSHDPVRGGYFQFLERDGTPLRDGYGSTPPKDQNSSIHLLEAFTELYQAWSDDLVRERLLEMLTLIRDTIITERGNLTLFLTEDWKPVSYRDSTEAVREAHFHLDHVSFGHDVETAFLMLEASHVLGLENDTTTPGVAKKMVDHALRSGWDTELGGFFDRGYYFPGDSALSVIAESKVWWAQAEALNTLLLMADLFPDDEMSYYDRFVEQWEYTKKYLLDDENGGWYEVGLDREPDRKTGRKGHIWKGAYHTARSLMACIDRLEG